MKKSLIFFSVLFISFIVFLFIYNIPTNEVTKNDNKVNDKEEDKIISKKIYLPVNGTYELDSKYENKNKDIVSIDNNILTALKVGNAIIENDNNKIEIVVSDLFKTPSLENNSEPLECNRYSLEEANLLDEILEYKINEAGYGTRGAVVEAARFLVLEFPYKISYFIETGRLNNYGIKHYVDGEGRYYHKGLYLHESKFSSILASRQGPAIWGCPLVNLKTEYGFTEGVSYPNGLDCSGFVTWALLNAGFDVKDSGAGETERNDDVSDLGTSHNLTRNFIASNNYKVGDIIRRDAHVAFIVGIDNTNIYVAEAFTKGLVIETFNKNEDKLYETYTFINTMDEVYGSEGKYENMW